MRRDDDPPAVDTDATDVTDEMVIGMGEHEMVARGTFLRIPLFGKCRHALLQLIAITREVVVVEHLKEQVAEIIIPQHLEEVSRTDVTRRQTVAMPVDVRPKTVKLLLSLSFRVEAEVETDGPCCLTIGAERP